MLRQLGGAGLDEEAARPKALLPRMKRLPAKRVVHLPTPAEGAPDPLPFTLSFNASHPLPPGASTPELAAFEITGGFVLNPKLQGVLGCTRSA